MPESEVVLDFFDAIERTRDAGAAVRDTGAPGPGILDAATFKALEVGRLFEALTMSGGCSTVIGQATLYRALCRPLASVAAIASRQEALRELAAQDRLRERLAAFTGRAAQRERRFYDLLFGSFMGFLGATPNKMEIEGYGYATYKEGSRFMLALAAEARALPAADGRYLGTLIETIRGYARSAAHALMEGPVYLTERGLRARGERSRYTPAIRFRATLFKPWLLAAIVLGTLMLQSPLMAPFIATPAHPVLLAALLPLIGLYVPMVGSFDRDNFIYPLRDRYRHDGDVQRVLAALGALDMLLAFHHYARGFGGTMVLPGLVDGARHSLRLSQIRNPILARANPGYVANDIELEEPRLLFITGPNSGGKTAFCKTLAQVQLLTQIGCYVPAKEARLAVADRIYYQTPESGTLLDAEGRFGTELGHTKEIFLNTSPRSLVILDEMAEGTTFEEKMEISLAILDGFHRIGGTTVLITHNHALVERFRKRRVGLCKQVDFVDDAPTYRLVDGISKMSHADRVARKLGFAREDIESYLRSRGY